MKANFKMTREPSSIVKTILKKKIYLSEGTYQRKSGDRGNLKV